MYVLDSTEEVLFDDEKGILIVKGNPGTFIQLQQQQRMMLKSLCERAGKVVSYSSLYLATHNEVASDYIDDKTVANDIQTKMHEIRKALKQAGIKDAFQLISTNRSAQGYEIHLPSNHYSTKALDQATSMHRDTLSNASLVSGAKIGAYYQEHPDCPISKSEIVEYKAQSDEEYLFEFHFSRLDYTPKFGSLALTYWEELDLKEYLEFDNDAAFCFDVDNVDGILPSISVEFKTGAIREVFYDIDNKLDDGLNHHRIPLSNISITPLAKICEVCFVIDPSTIIIPDGKVIIGNIHVDFNVNN